MPPRKLLIILVLFCANRITVCVNVHFENVRCHDRFCDSVICDKITDCSNGRILSNASYCNCCDICIPTIGDEQPCENPIEGSLQDISTGICKEERKCIDGKCVSDTSSCLKRRNFLKQRRILPFYANNLWIPDCDEEGNYKPKQTKNNGKSICVAVNGNRIFGVEEAGLSENMTCGCSRFVEKEKASKEYMIKPQVHCTSSGNFQHLQCIGDLCYCASSTTGRIEGRIVNRMHLSKLPCNNEEPPLKNYLTPCEEELQRSRKIIYDFHLKGISVLLQDPVRCDPDGTFAPVQCEQTVCVCTNVKGIGIKSYYIGIEAYLNLTTRMTCECARDVDSNGKFPELSCKFYGNFMSFHCFREDLCFCVDEDGDFISTEQDQATSDETTCASALKDLSEEPRTRITIPTTITDRDFGTTKTDISEEDYNYNDYVE